FQPAMRSFATELAVHRTLARACDVRDLPAADTGAALQGLDKLLESVSQGVDLGVLGRRTCRRRKDMTTLIANDLEKARRYFLQTKNRVVEVTTGLSEAQARFKPDPDRWSIMEILEHMATVHQRVMVRVTEQLPQAPPPEQGRDSQMLDALVL